MSAAELQRMGRWTVTPEALTLDPRISDRAFRLWCRLDRFAGENKVAFPGVETLAKELRTSRSSTARAIKELVDVGWLQRTMRPGHSNLYTLTLAPAQVEDLPSHVTGDIPSHVTSDIHKEASLEGSPVSPVAAVSPSIGGDHAGFVVTSPEVAGSPMNLTSSSAMTGVAPPPMTSRPFPRAEQDNLATWFKVTDGTSWVAAWEAAISSPTTIEYDPQVHLAEYLIKCRDTGQQKPRPDIWLKWFIEDRQTYAQKLVADAQKVLNSGITPQEREERQNRSLPPAQWGVTDEGITS